MIVYADYEAGFRPTIDSTLLRVVKSEFPANEYRWGKVVCAVLRADDFVLVDLVHSDDFDRLLIALVRLIGKCLEQSTLFVSTANVDEILQALMMVGPHLPIHNCLQNSVLASDQILRLGATELAELQLASKLAAISSDASRALELIDDAYMNTVGGKCRNLKFLVQRLVSCPPKFCSNHLLFGRRRFDWAIVDNRRRQPVENRVDAAELIASILPADRFVIIDDANNLTARIFRKSNVALSY